MNKKIKTEIALGIILIVAMFLGGSIWLIYKNDYVSTGNIKNKSVLTKTEIPTSAGNNAKEMASGNSSGCNSSLPEFGNASIINEKTILYTTHCTIKDSNKVYDGEYISRAYIRGAKNDYNKKIFETKEQILNASIGGNNNDVIFIITSDRHGKNEQKYFFNKKGERINYNASSKNETIESISPDKKYSASLVSASKEQYRSGAIIKITDTFSVKTKEYDFRKEVNPMNGLYIDSWSDDSRYVYVAGGIYEFEAPAKLWRIDVQGDKVKRYNLDGLTFPVKIYPEYGVAFAADGYGGEMGGNFVSSGTIEDVSSDEKKLTDLKLFKINLDSGDVTLFAKEKALGSFERMFFDGKDVYFEAAYGLVKINDDSFRNESSIKKVDFKNGENKLYSDDESHIRLFISEEKAFLMEKNKQMYYVKLENERQDVIGAVSTWVARVDKTGVEYITDVQGIVN